MAKTDPKTADAPASEMAGAPGELVKVRGPEDGRWRGGLQFGPIKQTLDLSTITAKDFDEIEADPYLRITRIPAAAPDPIAPATPAA